MKQNDRSDIFLIQDGVGRGDITGSDRNIAIYIMLECVAEGDQNTCN